MLKGKDGRSSSQAYSCIGTDSPYGRGMQEVFGFGDWSVDNCALLFVSAIMNNCSIIETRGLKPKELKNDEAKIFKQQGFYNITYLLILDNRYNDIAFLSFS